MIQLEILIDKNGKISENNRGKVQMIFDTFAGQIIIANFKKKTRKRSLPQNSLLWLYNEILGKELGYTAEEMHEVMKGEIFGYEEKKFGDEIKLVPKKHTKDLSTIDFAWYIQEYQRIAIQKLNVLLPDPE
jgi:hypothetical protein